MSIEKNYNIGFIAAMALREKQIQQVYRPIIAVHKWFARRPGTLFRGLILSEFGSKPVEDIYYHAQNFPDKKVADCFMGGGTPLLEANRVGCDVIGTDINPMATWVVREEIDSLDIDAYKAESTKLLEHLELKFGHLYKTKCPLTGVDADFKYGLWVKTGECSACHKEFDLFPGYMISKNVRHTAYVVVCHNCGDLHEVDDLDTLGSCHCGCTLKVEGNVKRNKAICPHCDHTNTAPFNTSGAPKHRLFAIEYYNSEISNRPGRLFKKPDQYDLGYVAQAENAFEEIAAQFVPDDSIPTGDETARLLKWGYSKFNELFNHRQLLALEESARYISSITDLRIKRALATNFSDLIRYQNMLCRYDTMALKSLDVFSIHSFPVGYVQCESNFIGIRKPSGVPVGSGGFINIIEKYTKAKNYCSNPFEVAFSGKKKNVVEIHGEWIGEVNYKNNNAKSRYVDIRCGSSTEISIEPNSLDAVFTDPPYYGMVQYGELMHFLYVWLRKLMGSDFVDMEAISTKHADELTGNTTEGRGIDNFAEGLAKIYTRMAHSLKPEAPLVFTYHHNKQEAYLAAGMAILDAGLVCTASLPCPAEMGGSIHISGTGSSIVDTVFVCRKKNNHVDRLLEFKNSNQLIEIIENELDLLMQAGMKPTLGDIRCIAYGHMTRMSISSLHVGWNTKLPTQEKLSRIKMKMDKLVLIEDILSFFSK
ncbi:DUF1156 domain-containing protein [Aeromonas media]|uniref:DUF1156 domain-containing protein n=1 Tax=Aeromonas media TaxID=651 RepID=UPI0038CFBE2D